MKLKKDWSLAYFLYYITWFLLIGLVLNFVTFFAFNFIDEHDFFTTMPVIDPMIEIDPAGFVNNDLLTNNEGVFLSPLSIHTRLMIQSDMPAFKSGVEKVHGIRIVRLVILFLFFFILTRILKSVVQKNPFEKENSKRLYIMGALLFALAAVNILHGYLIANALTALALEPSVTFSPVIEIDFLLFFGLVLLLLGYVFKEGARIYEEQKLTV